MKVQETNTESIYQNAEVFATDVMAYRKATIDFRNANPTFTGTASIAQITPYLLWGDTISTTGINNEITTSNIYVWVSGSFNSLEAQKVLEKMGYSLLVGYNQSSNLWSIKNEQTYNTGIPLPASIPNSSIVIIGE